MNQQAMLAEAIRSGQVETELRLVMMKAMTGSAGPNPLIEFFKNDRVIQELEIDADAIRGNFMSGYLKSPFCFCPCFWPHQLILGMPCMFLCSLNAVDAAVKAHKLILREHSIEYVVERYPAIGSLQSGMQVVKPCCAACQGDAGGFHEVYPLSDVSDIQVQLCQAECCGSKMAPDTLVVKVSSYNGGMHAAAAIDGPKNGDDFAERVRQQQKSSQEAGGVQIPADVLERYNKYMSGGAGRAGMMGGMMGMQMQAQMMQMQSGMATSNQMAAMQAAQAGAMAGACCAGVGAVPPVSTGQVVIGESMQRDGGEKDLATKIGELKALKDAGVLDDDEFKAAKAKLLGMAPAI